MGEDPTTEELRAVQNERAAREGEEAERDATPAGERAHRRRADKAAYLADKLAEQAESEKE